MKTGRHLLCLIIFLIFPSIDVFGQNESQTSSILKDSNEIVIKPSVETKKARVFSDYYRLDLNGDGHFEGISVENSDQGSSLHFFKNHFEHFQEIFIGSGGTFSKIEKIELRQISQSENVILIYFSEGLQKYLSMRSRQRLYLIYVPKNIFNERFKLDRGPIIFEELSSKGHYHVKKYDVDVIDLNGDGIKEVLVKNKDIERVIKLSENKKFVVL